MSDPDPWPCALCEHPSADLQHYRQEHPLPVTAHNRGTWHVGWDGRAYITYTPGHQVFEEKNP